jgi:lipopolysaccharide transport system ATP-binding protein
MDPDVLFVDEVLAVGDADFQKKCLNAMDNMRGGGRTVLFVSHNMGAIENLCPRTIWIDAGQIRMDGPTSDVIATYLATFAQSQQSGYDLRSITDGRGGNGAVRYTGIEFLDADGGPAQLFRVGEPLRARLHYEVHEEVREPHFHFRIYNDTGTLVTTIGNWNSGVHIPTLPVGPGQIEFEVENLNLLAARYYISLSIATTGRVYFDALEHCFSIDVERSNVLSASGRGTSGVFGIVYLPTTWHLSEVEQSS